jgi:hypothetical protein
MGLTQVRPRNRRSLRTVFITIAAAFVAFVALLAIVNAATGGFSSPTPTGQAAQKLTPDQQTCQAMDLSSMPAPVMGNLIALEAWDQGHVQVETGVIITPALLRAISDVQGSVVALETPEPGNPPNALVNANIQLKKECLS